MTDVEKVTLEKKLTIERTFTTEPARYITRGDSISRKRAKNFMHYLWNKKLRVRASFPTLEAEWVEFAGSNEPRTMTRYLGRPSQVVRYNTFSVTRIERQSGGLAQFDYHMKRNLSAKRGLLETLGFCECVGDGYVQLHHEHLPYYTQQTVIEVSPRPPLQETLSQECASGSNDNLCVSPIGSCGVRSNVASEETIDVEKREETYSTHTNQSGESESNRVPFTPEEARVLRVLEATVVPVPCCGFCRKPSVQLFEDRTTGVKQYACQFHANLLGDVEKWVRVEGS